MSEKPLIADDEKEYQIVKVGKEKFKIKDTDYLGFIKKPFSLNPFNSDYCFSSEEAAEGFIVSSLMSKNEEEDENIVKTIKLSRNDQSFL